MGENLLCVALSPIVFFIALEIHGLDKGIHRNVRQNGLLALIRPERLWGSSIEVLWPEAPCRKSGFKEILGCPGANEISVKKRH